MELDAEWTFEGGAERISDYSNRSRREPNPLSIRSV